MADNENKKSNEEVKKKPVEKKNTANQEKNKKIETKEISGSYVTGIIGAIIGGTIGAVPWIIAYIYGNMMIALLAILIAGGAYYGYKICKGKITKKVTIIITIISIIIVALVTLLIIPVILIHTEGMNTNLATIQYLYQDEEFTSAIIRDTLIAIVFTAVGVAVVNSSIKKDLEEGVANSVQTPEEFAKEKQEAISKIKPIFEKYNAVSKEHTIDKIELEAELELNKIDKYFIHCAIVEKDGKSILISGEPGSGKTTLAMYLCMEKGYKFVCNDRAVIGIENGIPFVYCGTLQTHIRVGVIHEYFPSLVDKISKDKMKRPWENKIYINPEFEELGITIEKNAKLSNILFTSTYPVNDTQTNLTKQMKDVATLATMKVVSEYIRADRNIILSTNYPFPNFDNQELAVKRMKFVEKIIDNVEIYTARGNIKKLSDIIDREIYKE